MKDVRVVIAVPLASPWIYWRTVAAILDMDKPFPSDLMVFQGALVDRARNELVRRMLDHPLAPTHIFFLDADIVPPADALMKLLKRKKDVVSGLYRKRVPPHEPMAFGKGLKPVSLGGKPLKQVDYVGGGCLLVRREVFERMKPPWFTVRWQGNRQVPEDFDFCEKAAKAGFKIWVDMSVKTLHLEPAGIGTDSKGTLLIRLEV